MQMFCSSVATWNAVDVLMDGLLQHGHVVSVVDGGLLIDWQCGLGPQRESAHVQLVEYGRIFQCRQPVLARPRIPVPHDDECSEEDVDHEGLSVQVLLRRHPNPGAAWIWYPGTAVPVASYHYEHFVWVQVQLSDGQGIVEELLPWMQVRAVTPPAGAGPDSGLARVVQGAFVIRSCHLPASASSRIAPALLLKQVLGGRRGRVLFVSLFNQTLLYLQRETDTPLTAEQVEGFCAEEDERRRYSACEANSHWLWQQLQLLGVSVIRPHSRKVSIPVASGSGTGACLRLPLPTELLLEVFRCLDSVGRVRCWRVCAAWHRILRTTGNFPDVCVSATEGEYGPTPWFFESVPQAGVGGQYWVVACLLKCLTARTQLAVFIHLQVHHARQLAAPLQHVLRPSRRRLPTLVFYDCDFGGRTCVDGLIGRTVDLAVRCNCERMVWKQCCMVTQTAGKRQLALVPLQAFSTQSQPEMERQLRAVWEENRGLQPPPVAPRQLLPAAAAIADSTCIGQPRDRETDVVR
ncbi:uncharacterized protein LOC129595138 [Paramacrobiotus metropolitanus]|uniref:uncharacterized protein LOC129595138 n=1 Tax=Paramacrobiotus metropolitanus TaxID=2943436 RepID=UPI002445AEF1|nr:uncharacterized protein LOC129595138 [Paramacrobiotus metropolitanus]